MASDPDPDKLLGAVTENEKKLRESERAAEAGIVAAYQAGASLDQLSAATSAAGVRGRSIETIRTILRRNGVTLRPRGRRHAT